MTGSGSGVPEGAPSVWGVPVAVAVFVIVYGVGCVPRPGTGTVTLGANTLTSGDATNTTFSGVLSGTGNLIKQGTGTFTLAGVNTHTGNTTLNNGTINLTGTLASEDPRVRRETVVSLSKIGGENAAILVAGMLGDADPDLRAAAARAVGVLQVERAYRPLVRILEDGDEDAVIEQVLRALGRLGDPSAVSVIEKRAAKKMFKGPSKAIRIAALTALKAIGTPVAMGIVMKARKDKDPQIRSAVEHILTDS